MKQPSASLAWLLSTRKGLAISCTSCPHNKTQDVLALAVRHGETATLDDLRPKLSRCPECGGKASFSVWSTEPPDMGVKGTWFDGDASG